MFQTTNIIPSEESQDTELYECLYQECKQRISGPHLQRADHLENAHHKKEKKHSQLLQLHLENLPTPRIAPFSALAQKVQAYVQRIRKEKPFLCAKCGQIIWN